MIVKPSADALTQSLSALPRQKGPPPVHLWNPPYCGEMDMRIARDGTWFHEGTPIGRPGLVRLFSSILKKEGDRYFLVTPVEKVGIVVEDAPMLAVDFDVADKGPDQVLTFHTKTEDIVVAGPENPIRVVRDAQTGEPSPYVLVRRNLEALIDRKSFYRLIDLGTHEETAEGRWFGLRSSGQFFPIIPSADLT
ncbi:DUF1285 domain-containing protein [Pseudotabrizicola sp. L79]|uniref:DUF1285 domain-containing protein n=1 Tax=Pseudotabrizicola sp. L79 TaxID=3118402 RepID=UPI002F950B8A